MTDLAAIAILIVLIINTLYLSAIWNMLTDIHDKMGLRK